MHARQRPYSFKWDPNHQSVEKKIRFADHTTAAEDSTRAVWCKQASEPTARAFLADCATAGLINNNVFQLF